MSGRTIAIGDIHGDIDKLNSLLNKLIPKKDDTFIFLGDYIDVGPHPKAVITRLIELSKQSNCIFLRGNHEDMLLKVVKTKAEHDIEEWVFCGGITTLRDYGDFIEMLTLHKEFFKQLKLYHLTDKYLFVHGGVRPDKSLEEQEEQDLLWIRNNFIYNKHMLKQKVIFGHTPFVEPYVDKDKIGINTGCGIEDEGYLTAFICDYETFVTSKEAEL
jgi:serine/threonine protein phosphatase 1